MIDNQNITGIPDFPPGECMPYIVHGSYPVYTPINWDKVKTLKDLKIVLAALNIAVDLNLCSEEIKKYV
jgi:hypothetical protein